MESNTDKLLRAFIEASGYEVKETGGVSYAREQELKGNNGLFTLAIEGVIDYKVTKQECKATKLLKEVIALDDNDDTSGDYEAKEFLLYQIRQFLNEKVS